MSMGFGLAQIADERDHVEAFPLEEHARVGQFHGLARRDRHARSHLGQGAGHGQPQSARATRDQGDATG
jgi:hypothetical protein